MMCMINNKVWYIIFNGENRGFFEWKYIISQKGDNKRVQKGFNAEERSKNLNDPTRNQSLGPTVVMFYFAAKPLALANYQWNGFTSL